MNNRAGFTLVEVIVILSVLAILAAVAIPVAFRIFQVTAEDTTREEIANLKDAIIGNPRKLQSTFRSDFGFLGDIGCLPTLLDFLYTQGALPPFTFDTAKQAGAGWKGPYITGAAVGEEPEDYKKDQWGNDYTYTPAAGPCPLTATLTSNSVDGQFGTADDITLSIVANETTATVRGTVNDAGGTPVGSAPVEFYAAVNGVLTTTTTTTDSNGNYSFALVPFGARAVMAGSSGGGGLTFVTGSQTVFGGSDNNVRFQMINNTASPVTITDINVQCTGAARYDEIEIDGFQVTSTQNNPCGTLLNTTDRTIAASSSPSRPVRVFVDSADSQLPNLTFAGGTTATIEIYDFESSGGSNFDMTGQSVTVTFYNGAAVVGTASFTL